MLSILEPLAEIEAFRAGLLKVRPQACRLSGARSARDLDQPGPESRLAGMRFKGGSGALRRARWPILFRSEMW
jgi:hypothetical protein